MGKYLPGKEDYKKALHRKSSWVFWVIMGTVGLLIGHWLSHGGHL